MKVSMKYKILTLLMWIAIIGFGLIASINLAGIYFQLEPLSHAATQDMSELNNELFEELEYDSPYRELYGLKFVKFRNTPEVWCKAKNLYPLSYVPGLDSWIWTGGFGDRVFRPYQKYGYHSYLALDYECTDMPFYIAYWRVENFVKFGFFGYNHPLNQ